MPNEELVQTIRDLGDKPQEFIPGVTYIPVDDSVSNGDETVNLITSILGSDKDFLHSFTMKLFDHLGDGYVNVVGSSMSAHILLMKVLGGTEFGSKGIRAGDEIITTAGNIGIINSALLCGINAVIVDVDLHTMLPDPIALETMVAEGKTKAIILSSPNGSSSFGEIIRDICDDFGIMFIEDIGYGFGGKSGGFPVGHYADVSIFSFHSNLLGDAGVIVSKSELIHRRIAEACNMEMNSHLTLGLGSNKMAYAFLDAQMDKTDFCTSMRRLNWQRLHAALSKHSKFFRFQAPLDNVHPSWSAFLLTLKEPYPFTKEELMAFLEERKIGTRSVVGNLFLFDAYKLVPHTDEELMNSNYHTRNSLVIGCHPNITSKHVEYIVKCFDEFLEKNG